MQNHHHTQLLGKYDDLQVLVSLNGMQLIHEIYTPFQWCPLCCMIIQKSCRAIKDWIHCYEAFIIVKISQNVCFLVIFQANLIFGSKACPSLKVPYFIKGSYHFPELKSHENNNFWRKNSQMRLGAYSYMCQTSLKKYLRNERSSLLLFTAGDKEKKVL